MSLIDTRSSHDDIDGVPPPAANPSLVGHAREWQEFVAASRSDRMHHAWLLQGPRGIGKATLAFAFARHLVAASWTAEGERSAIFDPDDAAVRQIASGAHPNVIHIQRGDADRGGGFKTQITVDEVRRLQGFFRATATPGWRVAILDPADDLNRNAANALLKILEEPPARSVFLITNHAPGRLLPTIRSRCRTLRIDSLSNTAVASATRQLVPGTDGEDLSAVAALARGSVRQALILLQGGGVDVLREADRILDARQPDWQGVHSLLDGLQQKGREAAFDLFRDRLFDRVAEEATAAVAQGRAHEGALLAGFGIAEQARFREAAAYNLDRKQTILSFLNRYLALRAGATI